MSVRFSAYFFVVCVAVTGLSAHAEKAPDTPSVCALNLLDDTKALIAYISSLLDLGLIKIPELHSLEEPLKTGRLINPISAEKAKLNPVLQIHRDGLEEGYFSNPKVSIDLKVVAEWVERTVHSQSIVDQERNKTKEETVYLFRKALFHKISKGSFARGFAKDVPAELTRDFYMSDTHITQGEWFRLMKSNPSSHKRGDESVVAIIGGKSARILPDNPVTNVTWWSTLEFANRLSSQQGLRAAYDLSEIPFIPGTSAEKGNLAPIHFAQAVRKLKILSSDGTVYGAEGYRLPTDAEMEYFLTNQGTAERDLDEDGNRYAYGGSAERLDRYAWYSGTAKGRPHEVASKKPIMVAGNLYYDMHGNVETWCWDPVQFPGESHNNKSKGGINPLESIISRERATRGGSFEDRAFDLSSFFTYLRKADQRYQHVGFRLVRTVR